MANLLAKYEVYRKYKTTDGVNYEPLDELQVVKIEDFNLECYDEVLGEKDLVFISNTKGNVAKLNNEYYYPYNEQMYDGKFFYASTLSELGIEKLTDCNWTFEGNHYLKAVIKFPNTSGVTNMEDMFYDCTALTYVDLSSFDTSNVTNMYHAFSRLWRLPSLDVSNFDTSNVTNMSGMFDYSHNLTSLDVSNFNTSAVTNMSSMFSKCSGLTSLDLSNFDISKVTDISYMFYECKNLTSLNLSGWDFSNIRDLDYCFANCKNLQVVNMNNTKRPDMSYPQMNEVFSWYDENVPVIYACGCDEETISWIKDIAPYGGTVITECGGSETPDTGVTTDDTLSFEFTGDSLKYSINLTEYTATTSPYAITLDELGITNWRSASNMFHSEINLTKVTHIPDTSKVQSMGYMFYNCSGLTSLDVSNFNTSAVTNMGRMFGYCRSLTTLDVSNFNTSNVTSMKQMFYACSVLISLDLSNFDTSNVTDMASMFGYCSSLISLDLSNFDTSNVTDMTDMFAYCNGLVGIIMRNCSSDTIADIESALTSAGIRDQVTIIF